MGNFSAECGNFQDTKKISKCELCAPNETRNGVSSVNDLSNKETFVLKSLACLSQMIELNSVPIYNF